MGMIVSGSYLNLWDEYLLEHDPKVISILAYLSKVILFVVIRDVKMYPSSKINHALHFSSISSRIVRVSFRK